MTLTTNPFFPLTRQQRQRRADDPLRAGPPPDQGAGQCGQDGQEAAKLKAKEDAKKAAQVDAMQAKLEQQQQEIAAAEQFRDNVISQGLCQWDGNNGIELTAAGWAAAEAHHSQ